MEGTCASEGPGSFSFISFMINSPHSDFLCSKTELVALQTHHVFPSLCGFASSVPSRNPFLNMSTWQCLFILLLLIQGCPLCGAMPRSCRTLRWVLSFLYTHRNLVQAAATTLSFVFEFGNVFVWLPLYWVSVRMGWVML